MYEEIIFIRGGKSNLVIISSGTQSCCWRYLVCQNRTPFKQIHENIIQSIHIMQS